MRAFLLIDLQNDFMPGGALPVTDGDAVITPINARMGDYPLIVATQDWHPEGHESFASAHPRTSSPLPRSPAWPTADALAGSLHRR